MSQEPEAAGVVGIIAIALLAIVGGGMQVPGLSKTLSFGLTILGIVMILLSTGFVMGLF